MKKIMERKKQARGVAREIYKYIGCKHPRIQLLTELKSFKLREEELETVGFISLPKTVEEVAEI